jgi:HD-like signal output (HDOD) protein
VNEQLKNADIDLKALSDTINHDQVLAARVLRMSNSAYFGCSRSIKTIEDAVALIGLKNLETLVVASAVTTTFTSIPGVDMHRFWLHSLVTASVARQLSDELGLESGTAYIAGLLHSIGQLPIHIVFPAAGAQVTQACKGVSVLERKNIEQSILGIDHCQIGEVMAKLWNFPEAILCVLRHYAEPFTDEEACNCVLAPVVNAAAHIASDIEEGKPANETAQSLDSAVAQHLHLSNSDALAAKIESYQHFVAEANDFLN